MNRTRSIRAAAVAAAALLAADAAAVNFPLGTFIYAGCAMNYRHEVLTEDDGVTAVEVRDVAGEWTVLENSELPFVPTDVSPGFEFVFAAPDRWPLANVATGLRIRFGYAENLYVGLPEIEVLGDLASKATTLILVK